MTHNEIDKWVAVQEQHETELGCVDCGCAEPTDGWQGRVSQPREGWLCGSCTTIRFGPDNPRAGEVQAALTEIAIRCGATVDPR